MGAPHKKEKEKKRSMTCSISETTSDNAIRLFGNRGTAIELAVKHHKHIKGFEKKANKIIL